MDTIFNPVKLCFPSFLHVICIGGFRREKKYLKCTNLKLNWAIAYSAVN